MKPKTDSMKISSKLINCNKTHKETKEDTTTNSSNKIGTSLQTL